MFNIVAFNHAVLQWQPKMVPATDANKELACEWIRDMAPTGSTFIEGALQVGFKIAGMGAYDKAYPGVGVDTIILLSDGAPTDNSADGLLADTDAILKQVAEWNLAEARHHPLRRHRQRRPGQRVHEEVGSRQRRHLHRWVAAKSRAGLAVGTLATSRGRVAPRPLRAASRFHPLPERP